MAYEAEKQRIYTELTAAIGITRTIDPILEREAEERAFEAREQVGLNACNCISDQIIHPTAIERRARLKVPDTVGTAEIALWGYQHLDPVGNCITGWLSSTPHRQVLQSTPYDFWGLGIYTELPPGMPELERRWYFVCWFSTEAIEIASAAKPTEILNPTEPLLFMGGTHHGYKFSFNGDILERKDFALTGQKTYRANGRGRINNRTGIWLRVDTGPLAGFWVQEKGFTSKQNTEPL